MWLQLHGVEAWRQPSSILRWSAENSNLITCVSRHTRMKFLRWANVEPDMVCIIPNTFDQKFEVQESSEFNYENYGLTGKRFILTISRLSRDDGYKGHDKVIRCMPELCREYDNLVYVIGGDGDLRHDLQELAKSLRVDHAVMFLGEVERAEMPSLYRAADVFVMPSSGEGFGIVYLESLACGTPVIAGQNDGARDPLHDGAFGVLCEDKNLPIAIRKALQPKSSLIQNQNSNKRKAKAIATYFGKSVFLSSVEAITTRLQRAA